MGKSENDAAVGLAGVAELIKDFSGADFFRVIEEGQLLGIGLAKRGMKSLL